MSKYAQQKETKGRSSYINHVEFKGNLGRDPEVKTIGDKEVINVSLALAQPPFEEDTPTMWFDLDYWIPGDEDASGIPEAFLALKKGDRVEVAGGMRMRVYNEKAYYKILVTSIKKASN